MPGRPPITGRELRIGDHFRYPEYDRARLASIVASEFLADDACRANFYWVTHSPAAPDKPARLEKGIWPVAQLTGPDATKRRPALLLRSTPYKAGSTTTPWHDLIDHSGGVVLYYGDNKPMTPVRRPEDAPGNKYLLEQAELHQSSNREERRLAAPLPIFSGAAKGVVRFEGIGLITRTEIVSQVDRRGIAFSNLRVECALVSLAAEGSALPWDWIAARRDKALTLTQTLEYAPVAWRRWVEEGPAAVSMVRRQLAVPTVLKPGQQLPDPGTRHDRVLDEVIAFHGDRKHAFEALALRVMQERLAGYGLHSQAWITRPGGDGGYDMVGRLDVGDGNRPVKLVVLGQAKCVHRTGVSAEQLARLVARLQRGWFGVFVTTGYFSEPAQKELEHDKYPVMLVDGRQVAETVLQLANAETDGDVQAFLEAEFAKYEGLKSDLPPEQILIV